MVDNTHHNKLAREAYHRNKHKHKEKRKVYNTKRKQLLKIKAIEYKGGKCSVCGGVFPPCVYDFHHMDPKEKEYNPSVSFERKWETAKKELDKCILVCSNCHRIIHHTKEEDGPVTKDSE